MNSIQEMDLDLEQRIKELLGRGREEVDDLLGGSEGEALVDEVQAACERAYEQGDKRAETTVQSILNSIYQLQVTLPPPGKTTAEGSSLMSVVRNVIEDRFLANEEARVPAGLLDDCPRDPSAYKEWFFDLVHGHSAYTHPLYEEYLPKRGTAEDLRYLLVQESTIDAATDDFIALVQVGVRGQPKLEMASNYWDEMGNGSPESVHSTLFDQALRRFGISLDEPEVPLETEALACGNLQLMLGLRREHVYKAIGYFAVVEYMAPARFTKLMHAWKRLGLGLEGADYHLVHIDVDQDHAEGWFGNVVLPLVAQDAAVVPEISRGAIYRLNTSTRYLDCIFPRFPSRSDALAAEPDGSVALS